jgi:tripeptidyl-peptidase-1
VCRLFGLLGARGVTALVSSGDSGVGSPGQDEGAPACPADKVGVSRFLPGFPASCPYVTAVGGTSGFAPEVAAGENGSYASGGGFSNYFSRPGYQKGVLDAWFNKHGKEEFVDPQTGGAFEYNRTGRGFPDIAAQSVNVVGVWRGKEFGPNGTSAAAPIMAGVIALLNDHLLAKGLKPLGFMNPWLYKVGHEGFTDIVSGSAWGCRVSGFPAVPGWDPVTGFGTPVSSALLCSMCC